jgi:hypothetical protein
MGGEAPGLTQPKGLRMRDSGTAPQEWIVAVCIEFHHLWWIFFPSPLSFPLHYPQLWISWGKCSAKGTERGRMKLDKRWTMCVVKVDDTVRVWGSPLSQHIQRLRLLSTSKYIILSFSTPNLPKPDTSRVNLGCGELDKIMGTGIARME